MSVSTTQTKPRKQRRRKPWIISAALVTACILASVLWNRQEPSFEGKSVSEWFKERLAPARPGAGANANRSVTGAEVDSADRAFVAMEGDAIPFLARWLNARPALLDKAYTRAFPHLPLWAQRKLPPPRNDSYFFQRESLAVSLLGRIGQEQRFKADMGEPSAKTPISEVVPRIHKALTNINRGKPSYSESMAAQALRDIGPPAAAAVPDLMMLAGKRTSNFWSAPVAIQSFGTIGPAASNAVGLLTEISASSSSYRLSAVTSLGGIGLAATPAVPVLCQLLKGINYPMRTATARTLGEIGIIPDDAVAILVEMREKPDPILSDSINAWVRTVATFALWNRFPENLEFKAELEKALQTERRGSLAFSLARLGAKAAPFVPALTELAKDPDSDVRRLAKTALHKIQTSER